MHPEKDPIITDVPPPASSRHRAWNTALGLGCAATLILLASRRNGPANAAWPLLRTADQFLAGHGPVLNAGERVEAAASALWQWLLIAFEYWFSDADPTHLARTVSLLLSGVALLLAVSSAAALRRRLEGHDSLLLPFGALVLLALPPVWDFAASGLDTALSFAWFAAAYRVVLANRPGTDSPLRRAGLTLSAVLIGLGPLVRPGYLPASLCFLTAMLVLSRAPLPARFRALTMAAILPAAYEVFRAGYYGMLLPMPSVASWLASDGASRGGTFASDLLTPYWLVIPLVCLGAAALVLAFSGRPPAAAAEPAEPTDTEVSDDQAALGEPQDRSDALILVLTPLLAGAATAALTIRSGGSALHTGELLPALFCVLLPVAAAPARLKLVPAVALVAVWAVLCVGLFRAEQAETSAAIRTGAEPITTPPPGTLSYLLGNPALGHYAVTALKPGTAAAAAITVAEPSTAARLPLATAALDVWGTGDLIGGHLLPGLQSWPGHEHYLDVTWILARYADPAADPSAETSRLGQAPFADAPTPSQTQVTAARQALTCGALNDLRASAEHPLDPVQIWRNLLGSARRTHLGVPSDPVAAQAKFCHTP